MKGGVIVKKINFRKRREIMKQTMNAATDNRKNKFRKNNLIISKMKQLIRNKKLF